MRCHMQAGLASCKSTRASPPMSLMRAHFACAGAAGDSEQGWLRAGLGCYTHVSGMGVGSATLLVCSAKVCKGCDQGCCKWQQASSFKEAFSNVGRTQKVVIWFSCACSTWMVWAGPIDRLSIFLHPLACVRHPSSRQAPDKSTVTQILSNAELLA